MKRTRVERRLRIEELEPRCAPVTLEIGQTTSFLFIDGHNNEVVVTLSGKQGRVTLLDALGQDPSHSDIATVRFSDADGTTSLVVDVVKVGTMSLGTFVGNILAEGQALGNITVDGSLASITAGSVRQLAAKKVGGKGPGPFSIGSVRLDAFGPGSSLRADDLGSAEVTLGVRNDFSAGAGLASLGGAVLGDFNKDGNQDVAAVDAGAGVALVWLGSSSGAMTLGGTFDTGAGTNGGPVFLAAADINKDTHLDLVVANSAANNIAVLMGNGNGTFQTAQTTSVGDQPVALALGDFNGDGWLDVATANFASNDVSVLLANTNGTFQSAVTYVLGTGTVGAAPGAIAAGDLNKDGSPDLVTANSGANCITVLMGSTEGTFGQPVTYGTGTGNTSPRNVALGDLNKDGVLDVVVANYGVNSLATLQGSTEGTLGAVLTWSSLANPLGLALADMNGDGVLDAVVGSGSLNLVGVQLGSTAGGFGQAASYGTAVGSTVSSVVAGRLNSDGLLDVAAVGPGLATLGTFLGTTGGMTVGSVIAGKIDVVRDLNGIIIATGSDVSGPIKVGHDVGASGGVIAGGTGGAISGNVTIGNDLLGVIIAEHGDIAGKISVGRDIGTAGVIWASGTGGQILSPLNVGRNHDGLIASAGELSGGIKIGGSVGASGRVRSGSILWGPITVGGDMGGHITSARGGIRGKITINGAGGFLASGSIVAAGSAGAIAGNILIPKGAFAGQINTSDDILGKIIIGGTAGMTTTGSIVTGSGAALIGQLTLSKGSLNGTINTGLAVSQPIIISKGSFNGEITTGAAFGGMILSSKDFGHLAGDITAATNVGTIRVGGWLSGTITTSRNFVERIVVNGSISGSVVAAGSIPDRALDVGGTIMGTVVTHQLVSRGAVVPYNYRERGKDIALIMDNLNGETYGNAAITIGNGTFGGHGAVSVDVGTIHLNELRLPPNISFGNITAANVDLISAASVKGVISLNTFDANDRIVLTNTASGLVGGMRLTGSDLAGVIQAGTFGTATTSGFSLFLPNAQFQYVTQGPTRSDTTPVLARGHAAWVSGSGASSEIFYWDGSQITQITANNLADSAPSLYVDPVTGNPSLVWVENDGTYGQIMYWNGISTRALTQSTNGSNLSPSVYGGKVVWQGPDVGTSGNSQIYFLDLASTQGAIIIPSASTAGSNTAPSLWYDVDDVIGGTHGARIAWVNSGQINYWNGTTTQLIGDASGSSSPSIGDGWLVWKASSGLKYMRFGTDGAPIGDTTGTLIPGAPSVSFSSGTAPKVGVSTSGAPLITWDVNNIPGITPQDNGVWVWDGSTAGAAYRLTGSTQGDTAPVADRQAGGRIIFQHTYGSGQTNIQIGNLVPCNVTGTLTAGTFAGNMDIAGSILPTANFGATNDIAANIVVRGSGGIGTAINLAGNLSGSLIVTNADIANGITVGSAFTGTIGTANGSIRGDIVVGKTFGGHLLATNGDLVSNIVIPGDMSSGSIQVLNGNILGNISILGNTAVPGNLNGHIGVTNGDLFGNVVINGSIQTGGDILAAVGTGGGLLGNIYGSITVGDSIGSEGSTLGSISASGNIGSVGTATGSITVGNNVWGRIESLNGSLLGPISVGNDVHGQITAEFEIQSPLTVGHDVGAGGVIQSGTTLFGAITVGHDMAGLIGASGGNIRSDISIGNDLNGAISMGVPVDGSIRGSILVGRDIGSAGSIISAGLIEGGITVGHDVQAGGEIQARTFGAPILVTNDLGGFIRAPGGVIDAPITIGRDVGEAGGIEATGNLTGNIQIGNDLLGQIASKAGEINAPISVGRNVGTAGAIQAALQLGGTITLGSGGDMMGLIAATNGNLSASIFIPHDLSGVIAATGGNINGSITVGNNIASTGLISAASTGKRINAGVVLVQNAIQGRIETGLSDGVPFTWEEGAGGVNPKYIVLTGASDGRVVIDGAFGTSGLGAMADITSASLVTSIQTTNVEVHDITAPQASSISVASNVAGTITLGVFSITDSIVISGNLGKLMITSGDLAGNVHAVDIGSIGVAVGALTGTVVASGNLGDVDIAATIANWQVGLIPTLPGVTNNILPSLYAGEVAWQGTDTDGYAQIYFWDGASTLQITSGAVNHLNPSLYNGWIAWQEGVAGDYDIMFWDGSTVITIAGDTSGEFINPSLGMTTSGDPFLAWEYSGEIYYWDGAMSAGTPIVQQLTTSGGNHKPAASDGTIAWIRNDMEILFWDGATTVTVAFVGTTGTVISNDGGHIVWDGMAGGITRVIYLWDGEDVVQVSATHGSSVEDFAPSIFDNSVAWHQRSAGIDNIHYWNGNVDQAVTSDTLGHSNPSLYGNQIAWQNGDDTLSLATLHFTALTGTISAGNAVGAIRLHGDVLGSGKIVIVNDLAAAASIQITGDAQVAGDWLDIGHDLAAGATVTVTGTAGAGSATGIRIGHDMFGTIGVGRFGGVYIGNDFQAGATLQAQQAGVGNKLTVVGALDGAITPANAFATIDPP